MEKVSPQNLAIAVAPVVVVAVILAGVNRVGARGKRVGTGGNRVGTSLFLGENLATQDHLLTGQASTPQVQALFGEYIRNNYELLSTISFNTLLAPF